MRPNLRRAWIAALALGFAACGSSKTDAVEDAGEPSKAAVEPEDEAGEERTAATPKGPEETPAEPGALVQKFAASHVVVQYEDAMKAGPEVTRSKDEALARAREALAKIRDGADFEKIAREYSDGPEKERGGRLGAFMSDRIHPVIAQTVTALEVGQVSQPIETPFGFHLIRRDALEEIFLAHILVAIGGAPSVPPSITRTKAEAKQIVRKASAALKKPNAEFGAIAMEFSDHPSKEAGGMMGPVARGMLRPEMEQAAFALEGNGVAGPLETPQGFVFLKRLPAIHTRHVLLMHRESRRAPPSVTRSRDEARALADEVAARIAGGADFAEVARELSDCPSKSSGGDLGLSARGMMDPEYEEVAFALDVGEVSGVVESAFGFHVIKRLP